MFVEWLHEKLLDHNIPRNYSLKQLNLDRGCDLSLVVTDTTHREMMVLNHRTAPDVPVAMAVRMSMSIPFVWREVVWQAEWGYCGAEKTNARIVDGGVLSNFPIDLVAARDARILSIMGADADHTASHSLGMLIDEGLAVPRVQGGKPVRPSPLRTVQRIQRIVDTMTGARDNALIDEYGDQVCRLPAKGYGTTEFDMPKEKVDCLVEAGRTAMRAHLAGRSL